MNINEMSINEMDTYMTHKSLAEIQLKLFALKRLYDKGFISAEVYEQVKDEISKPILKLQEHLKQLL